MKRLVTILLICCCNFIFAQNWSPILVNGKMNYQHSDSSYISHTIWVDTIDVTGTDTTFFLNKIVTDHPNDPNKVLRNQPQFLYIAMIRLDDGIYHFADPGFYILQTFADLNDSWVFDLDNNITAEVTQITEDVIFDVLDSVKTLSLSDGNEIRFSKNFGIIKFPDFENGVTYELVGIQGTDYGESVPGFWEIFDFEVGDVFQFHYTSQEVADVWNETQKYRVDSKVVIPDNVEYQFYKIVNGYYIGWMGGGYDEYAYSEIVNITYYDSVNHPCNNFNNELVRMWEDDWGYFGNDLPLSRTTLQNDSLGNTIKKMGMKPDGSNLYYEIDPNNDTLLQNGEFFCFDITYTEGLGTTNYCFFYFEQMLGYSIQGFIKDGDTVGTITPDSLLLVGIKENNTLGNIFTIFPNPANDWIYIKSLNLTTKSNYEIELRNLYGQMVKEEKHITSGHYTWNVADLKPGVYFYIIEEKGVALQQGKLIKK